MPDVGSSDQSGPARALMDVPTLNPMRALDASVPPFTDPAWLYEIKFDKYRPLAYVDRGRVALRTKKGADCTSWFPEAADALAAQFPDAQGLIIDGQACVLDSMGRSDFNRLQAAIGQRRPCAVSHESREIREQPFGTPAGGRPCTTTS